MSRKQNRFSLSIAALTFVMMTSSALEAAIIGTSNGLIRTLMTDGFGGIPARDYIDDGKDPGVGDGTLDLKGGGFNVNAFGLGIYPAATTWEGPFWNRIIEGDGAATQGGITAGFNSNFFGFALTENIFLTQQDDDDPPGMGETKVEPARLRVDFSADFQNNGVAIPAGGGGVLGIFTNFFGNLPAPGDFAAVQVSLTMSNYLPGGGGAITVNADTGGDPANPVGFFWRTNGPTAGGFIDDISNAIAFPGVAANNLVTLQGHIDLAVDPASVSLADINPDTFVVVPEPSALLLAAFTGVGLLMRRRV